MTPGRGRKPAATSSERVQKVLAARGVASRRHAEEWIAQGRVTVNEKPATLGQRVGPGDRIAVDGKPVEEAVPRVYWMVHKPEGYTSSLADRHAAHLVTELLPQDVGRLFPVGRLDRDSSGLLLMTNDGALAHRLMHPRYGVPKVYEVWVEGVPGGTHLERLARGIVLREGDFARADAVKVIKVRRGDVGPITSLLRITLHEGHKREVRRLLQAVHHGVMSLKRVAYAGLELGDLKPGNSRPLRAAEVQRLRDAVAKPLALKVQENPDPGRGTNSHAPRGRGSGRGVGASRPRHSVR